MIRERERGRGIVRYFGGCLEVKVSGSKRNTRINSPSLIHDRGTNLDNT